MKRQSVTNENSGTMYEKQPAPHSGGRMILLVFVLIFGLGFGIVGLFMVRSAYLKEKRCSAETTGTIVDYGRHYSKGHDLYSPIVEYRVGDQVFSSETNVRFNYRPFKKGEGVSIFYNPQNPGEFYIEEYDVGTTYRLGVIFLFVSVAVLIISALFFVMGRITMDPKKKARMEGKIFIFAALLFVFTVFSCLAGLGKTICIFAVMGLFALYGRYRDRRKK